MQSLTDRMAAMLRRVEDEISEATGRETRAELRGLLAEYDAERNPPPVFQVGQFVRSKHEPDNPMWQGQVTGVISEGLVFFQTADCPASAMSHLLELVPNLPATNTGD